MMKDLSVCLPRIVRTIATVSLISAIAACGSTNAPESPQSNQPVSAPTEEPATSADSDTSLNADAGSVAAVIQEIHQQPVWVRVADGTEEESATEGRELTVGDRIRTESPALAEVDLNNGLAFRIGGDASLTLQPEASLQLESGEMITWLDADQNLPAEIVTPVAIAGIRGTTVYIQIPENPEEEGILFFAWEGTVSVQLPDQPGELILNSGEEVRIRPGDRNIDQLRERIQRLRQREWRERLQSSPLVQNFNRPLPTLEAIRQVMPPNDQDDVTEQEQDSEPEDSTDEGRNEEIDEVEEDDAEEDDAEDN